MKQEARVCQSCKQNFAIEPEDFDFYKKIDVPPPTFCWKCRFQRRVAYRNERKPFWNKSAKSGKKILSLYPADSGVVVYDDEEWRSDSWDALSYGVDYDFTQPFFKQIHELSLKVPRPSRSIEDNVNCEYLVNSGWSKNCYLLSNTTGAEDSAYGNAVDYCKSCFDNSHIGKCERCYGCFWIRNSYRSYFCERSIENNSVWFCFGSKGLSNCFGCVNLLNKSYHIFNKPYSKEDYEKKIGEMKLNTWSGFQKARAEAMAFSVKFPYAYLNGIFHDDVTGEYISNSKNVHYGYLIDGGKDLKYVQYLQMPSTEDSYDLTIWGQGNVRAYENATSGLGVSNSKFLLECWDKISDSEYCMFSRNISNCFGCVGLRKKQYCIFNKQYTKEEYAILIPKIKKQMDDIPYVDKNGRIYKYGEFYPMEHSPFGYNTSLVAEYFPLTRGEALAEGCSWSDSGQAEYKTTMSADDIPDAIENVTDEILKEIIECAQCKRAYRIIKPELVFLRMEKIPVPRTCVDCRHNDRITRRAKPFLYHRKCQCSGKSSSNGVYDNFAGHFHGTEPCPNEFETTYEKNRPEIIYCLKCFWSEIG